MTVFRSISPHPCQVALRKGILRIIENPFLIEAQSVSPFRLSKQPLRCRCHEESGDPFVGTDVVQKGSCLHAEVHIALICAVLECIEMPLPIGGMLLP